MFTPLARAGDRLLSLLVPQLVASACQCPPDQCWTQYRCHDGKWQTRNCCYTCNCGTTCSAWTTIAKCGT